jgi:UDP-N-acetyl-2-amino-2-deoxyglucuronate dehydrogenase
MKLGIIGKGNIVKEFLPQLARVEGLEVVALMGSPGKETEAASFCAAHGITNCVTSLEEMVSLGVDTVYVATPNLFHFAQCKAALELGLDVICEKPLVLNPWNIDALKKMEEETGKTVYNILQLRLHPAIIQWKEMVDQGPKDKVYDVDLTYITSRGLWYYTSWKGDVTKSGGVATNIGVHFYDMLSWIFGKVKENIVHIYEHDRAAGLLVFEKARVRYFLSINADTLPKEAIAAGKRTFRKMEMDGKEIEFSDGFTELHTESYKNIFDGKGFGLDDARQCISIVHDIRNSKPIGLQGDYHPLAALPLDKHPFFK